MNVAMTVTDAKSAIWAACLAARDTDNEGILTLPDGTILHLTFMTPDFSPAQKPEQVEYIWVGGPCWTLWIGGNIDELAKNVSDAARIKADWANRAKTLREIYEDAVREGRPTRTQEYGEYSDFHKEVFGYRPRGWEYDPRHNAF